MFDLASRTELSVKDFKSYPDEYPFRDPTCLTRSPDTLRKELAKMRVEDEADDQLIADSCKLMSLLGLNLKRQKEQNKMI